jgi:hypothetical protein
MIFDLNNLDVEILKKFDGTHNYFNPSHFNGRTIFRRESKFDDKLLVSDIVDDQDIVLLQHYMDDMYLWSYEDARFINESEISVCCCKRDKHDVEKIINVEFKKYNLTTKEFTHFKTQNSHFEKHWQFYNNKIIYHVNPYTIMDTNENIIYKKQINLQPWIEKYGNPGLSTNVFEINGIKHLLFHSYVTHNGINLKYYVGILKLNDDLTPIEYCNDPLFGSVEGYENQIFRNYFDWKRKLDIIPTIVDVIFPMTVTTDRDNINIYSGINDYVCLKIVINKQKYIENVKFRIID